jgi:phosphoglucosamine mutase
MTRLPQLLINVRVGDLQALAGSEAVQRVIAEEERRLEGSGRVLVRTSGTEPLVRVMVEAITAEDCEAACRRIAGVVEQELA